MAKEVNIPTISLNLRPYCNLLYPYTTINDLDKEVVLDDVRYWADVLKDIDVIMGEASKATIPANVEVLTKCKGCGSSDLVFATGKSQANGKVWYAFDCQSCKTTRGDNEYPTRNFVNAIQPSASSAADEMGLPADDEVPF